MNRYIVGSLCRWVDDFVLLKLRYGGRLLVTESEYRELIYRPVNRGSEMMYLHMLFYFANMNRWFLELKEMRKNGAHWWSLFYILELGKCIRYFEDVEILKIYAGKVEIRQIGSYFLDVIEYASQLHRFEIVTAFQGLTQIAFQQALIHYLHPRKEPKTPYPRWANGGWEWVGGSPPRYDHQKWKSFLRAIELLPDSVTSHVTKDNSCPFGECNKKIHEHPRFYS